MGEERHRRKTLITKVMKKVLILVEGQTEEAFVKNVLSPHLSSFSLIAVPVICRTRRTESGKTFKGGVSSFARIEKQILSLLGDTSAILVTTMLDYYGLPQIPNIRLLPADSPTERVKTIERAVEEEIARKTSQLGTPNRFVAYISLHEFEALLFSDTDAIANQLGSENRADVESVRQTFKPEEIDDDSTTCPSARLKHIYPKYKKRVDGPLRASRIGISAIRSECPHFDSWLTRIEKIGHVAPQV